MDDPISAEYTPEIIERNLDLPNSSSLIFKISGKKQSMLFFADFEDAELADKLYEKYGHELDALHRKPIPILLKIHSFI